MISEALTHDHLPMDLYSYPNNFGLLTLYMSKNVYEVHKVEGSYERFVSLLCSELGYLSRKIIGGPSLQEREELPEIYFAHLTSRCTNAIHVSPPCFDFSHIYYLDPESRDPVDYIVCINNRNKVTDRDISVTRKLEKNDEQSR
jgi:hypothetical protein